jgi:hypothetical protein
MRDFGAAISTFAPASESFRLLETIGRHDKNFGLLNVRHVALHRL